MKYRNYIELVNCTNIYPLYIKSLSPKVYTRKRSLFSSASLVIMPARVSPRLQVTLKQTFRSVSNFFSCRVHFFSCCVHTPPVYNDTRFAIFAYVSFARFERVYRESFVLCRVALPRAIARMGYGCHS